MNGGFVRRRLLCALLAVLSLASLTGCTVTSGAAEAPYETELFGAGVITIDIVADPDAWAGMLENAIDEPYIHCDVTVNGETYTDVGIRPKGNSSLTMIARTDNKRFSFRLNFDKYVEGQSCFGLTNFVLNNMMADISYMKEYLSYDIMRAAGVNCPLFAFAAITVNGEPWGFYLAVEKYGDEFLTRYYGDDGGELYNVKMEEEKELGRAGGWLTPGDRKSPDMRPPDTAADGQEEGAGGMGAGKNGGALAYVGDDPESYSAIFDNAVSNIKDKDKLKVMVALKALSEGRDIESHFNVDQILRYFAAHTVVVNLDSYVSNMAQNYYLCEYNGVLTMLPWDYNLAFGGFRALTATETVNFPIDTPVSGVTMESRPLLAKLLENDAYREKYHRYLRHIVDEYLVHSDAIIDALDAMIGGYVETDVSAFYKYDQYKTAVATLKTLVTLRAESISGQLDGVIPSTAEAQEQNASLLVDASAINMKELGVMSGGGNPSSETNSRVRDWRPGASVMPSRELMTQGLAILREAGGTVTEEVKAKLLDIGITEEQISVFMPGGGQERP